jgi:inner membrane protein
MEGSTNYYFKGGMMMHFDLKKSIGARLLIIAAITGAFLIPSSMISGIINERESRRYEAVVEVVSKWAGYQTMCGPVLTVPYTIWSRDSTGKILSKYEEYIKILPESLHVSGVINPEIRYRGIYEVVVYGAKINIGGSFSRPDLQAMNIEEPAVHWQRAHLTIGLSDLKGIKEPIRVDFNGSPYLASPGTKTETVSSGVSIAVPVDASWKTQNFQTDISLAGSEGMNFIPVGKETIVTLKSGWRNPSFTGGFLPLSRDINKDGFTATWKVFNLNRNFPQTWISGDYNLSESAFGVGLFLPVDGYQTTTRTNKYSLLFIALTFIAFFFTEIIGTKPIHPMQYLFIGAAQVLFYILLLSLTEHMAFAWAYLVSTAMLVSMVSLYSISVLRNIQSVSLISVLLASLYLYLYIVLKMQDYALLLGSIGLFSILGVLMFITRNVDWFALFSSRKANREEIGI